MVGILKLLFHVCIQEIKESVELPLTHPEYYEEMGIMPPKGVGLSASIVKMIRYPKSRFTVTHVFYPGDLVRPTWHWEDIASQGCC